MGKFSGFLLASDFDGTLANSQGQIPENNRDAIEYFISQGGKFTVCTGRTKQGFHAFDARLMNCPLILSNGGMLYDCAADKVVATETMSAKHIPIMKELYKRFPFICIEMYSDKHNSFAYNLTEESRKHFERQSISFKVVDAIEQAEFPLVKLMIHVGKENTEAVQRYLAATELSDMKFIPSDGDFLEFLSKTTDKGRGLLRLADVLGISHERVYAVGDGSNDVDMLKAAAVGFVPENGDVFSKCVGDVIVKSNDEGAVADVICRLEAITDGLK